MKYFLDFFCISRIFINLEDITSMENHISNSEKGLSRSIRTKIPLKIDLVNLFYRISKEKVRKN